MSDCGEVTTLLKAAANGDIAASQKLIEIVYSDLKMVARHRMSMESAGHTLQPSAVVNEVFLRLFQPCEPGSEDWVLNPMEFHSRAQFLGLAAKQMRLVLIDHARKRKAEKRNFGFKVCIDHVNPAALGTKKEVDFDELNEQLELLARKDAESAKIVELKFFGGLTDQQVVAVTGTNLTKVRRDWEFARSFLRGRLQRTKKNE